MAERCSSVMKALEHAWNTYSTDPAPSRTHRYRVLLLTSPYTLDQLPDSVHALHALDPGFPYAWTTTHDVGSFAGQADANAFAFALFRERTGADYRFCEMREWLAPRGVGALRGTYTVWFAEDGCLVVMWQHPEEMAIAGVQILGVERADGEGEVGAAGAEEEEEMAEAKMRRDAA